MQMVKVYDADGKHVDSFRKSIRDPLYARIADIPMYNDQIKFLNASGFWIKGQTTSKGVKIK